MGSIAFFITTAAYCLSSFFFLTCLGSNEPKSIECFKCNSLFDPACGDPFDSFTIASINCSWKKTPDFLREYTPSFCRKTLQTIQGKTSVVRGCGYVKNRTYDGRCVKRSGTHDVAVTYCTCSTTRCNGTSKLVSSNMFLAILIGLYYSYFHVV